MSRDYFNNIDFGTTWSMSPTLIAHNCDDKEGIPDTSWCHCSRFDRPMRCRGCGTQVPPRLEQVFRDVHSLWEDARHHELDKENK